MLYCVYYYIIGELMGRLLLVKCKLAWAWKYAEKLGLNDSKENPV